LFCSRSKASNECSRKSARPVKKSGSVVPQSLSFGEPTQPSPFWDNSRNEDVLKIQTKYKVVVVVVAAAAAAAANPVI